jgi:uncharacterized protein (AIM24 family)
MSRIRYGANAGAAGGGIWTMELVLEGTGAYDEPWVQRVEAARVEAARVEAARVDPQVVAESLRRVETAAQAGAKAAKAAKAIKADAKKERRALRKIEARGKQEDEAQVHAAAERLALLQQTEADAKAQEEARAQAAPLARNSCGGDGGTQHGGGRGTGC